MKLTIKKMKNSNVLQCNNFDGDAEYEMIEYLNEEKGTFHIMQLCEHCTKIITMNLIDGETWF